MLASLLVASLASAEASEAVNVFPIDRPRVIEICAKATGQLDACAIITPASCDIFIDNGLSQSVYDAVLRRETAACQPVVIQSPGECRYAVSLARTRVYGLQCRTNRR